MLCFVGNQALPAIEKGSLSEVRDLRLTDTNDDRLIHHMAQAALLCLQDLNRRISMSEVKSTFMDKIIFRSPISFISEVKLCVFSQRIDRTIVILFFLHLFCMLMTST